MSASEQIKKRMETMGISQNALARKAGLSQSGLSTILSGKAKPREDSMEAIAKALNCQVADFYETEKAPENPGLNEFLLHYLTTLTPAQEKFVLDFLQLPEGQAQRVMDFVAGMKAVGQG